MWRCHKCGKPVYFAERTQSLGYDWHPWCLKCEECDKVLKIGQHAEHKGTPYCHIPCYSALFGPKLFGHGSTVESHQSFGQRSKSFIREQKDLFRQLRDYNAFFTRKPESGGGKMDVSHREVNSRLILEGVLRVYWGVDSSIMLKEFDDQRIIAKLERQRKTKSLSCAPKELVQFHPLENEFVLPDKDEEYDDSSSEKSYPVPEETASVWPQPDGTAPNGEQFAPPVFSLGQCESDKEEEGSETDPSNLAIPVAIPSLPERVLSVPNLHEAVVLRPELAVNKDKDRRKSANDLGRPQRRSRFQTMPVHLHQNEWDEFDELLAIERNFDPTERVYHTIHLSATLPAKLADICPVNGNHLDRVEPKADLTNVPSATSTLEQLFMAAKMSDDESNRASLPPYLSDAPVSAERTAKKKGGPRALRRRHGKKMDRSKVRRKSSINGHWYDRDTSVFTPPKGSLMSVYATSLLRTNEVIRMILDKYQVESDQAQFALYVIKENGERRLVTEMECPLLLRVNLGPDETIAKLYLLDRSLTTEIRHEVAQYLKFTNTECGAMLNMFYEQEEQEVEKIKYKFGHIKKRIRERMFDLRVRF
eukprot:maker-scaffold138_size318692-snap-gene-0.7 protein:Tk02742 transcript:maker-scaffold138_size318692-snap-gene-0.7-mRNA-1 annotation:"ras association domain-containing protein 2"